MSDLLGFLALVTAVSFPALVVLGFFFCKLLWNWRR
jgi:hypothetical protein